MSLEVTNRRMFLQAAGMAGAGLAMAAALPKLTFAQSAPSVVDVLNFALNLEYLEAEFYLKSTWNTDLVQVGVIPPGDATGPTTGGRMVPFNNSAAPIAYLASALRSDEVQHVIFLRSALGAAAVKKPAINLDALGFGYANDQEFLIISRVFEDLGVSAYAGAAPLLASDPNALAAAARIALTEAQHAGAIRMKIVERGIGTSKVDAKDLPPGPDSPFLVEAGALSVARSPQEVLALAGPFYPSGLNGTIR